MKTLFLIRHAKSSWDDPALPDKDRPLDDRGKRDAPKMGKRLAKRDVNPDLILSSPAMRRIAVVGGYALQLPIADGKPRTVAEAGVARDGGAGHHAGQICRVDFSDPLSHRARALCRCVRKITSGFSETPWRGSRAAIVRQTLGAGTRRVKNWARSTVDLYIDCSSLNNRRVPCDSCFTSACLSRSSTKPSVMGLQWG